MEELQGTINSGEKNLLFFCGPNLLSNLLIHINQVSRKGLGEVYDQLEKKKEEKETKPQYMNKLLVTAKEREQEFERRQERPAQKEREKEGDKEKSVTSSKIEAMEDAYRHLCRQTFGKEIGRKAPIKVEETEEQKAARVVEELKKSKVKNVKVMRKELRKKELEEDEESRPPLASLNLPATGGRAKKERGPWWAWEDVSCFLPSVVEVL